MSTNITTLNNNKSVFKGSGRDVGVNNGIENQSVFNTQPSNAFTTFRGPKQLKLSAGTTESFTARAKQIDDDYETFVVKFPLASDAVAANGAIFIAEHDYVIDSVKARWGAASTSLTATLYKANSGTALSDGIPISSALDTSPTVDTNNSATLVSESARGIREGQAVGIVFAGTATNLVGLVISITARRVIAGTITSSYIE